jgi:hypothetical protein
MYLAHDCELERSFIVVQGTVAGRANRSQRECLLRECTVSQEISDSLELIDQLRSFSSVEGISDWLLLRHLPWHTAGVART